MRKQTVSKIITILGTIFVGIGQVLRDLDENEKEFSKRNRRYKRRRRGSLE